MRLPRSAFRAPLGPLERSILAICRFANENPRAQAAQRAWQRAFGQPLLRALTGKLVHVEGLAEACALDPPRGVLLCANHRTFYDQFVIASVLYRHAPWAESVCFPVRSNYFYETIGGLLVNGLIAGFAMYPPIFRDPRKSEWNTVALDTVAERLMDKGTLVGMHPEGTRGKGPDPYEMLPAQPGVGQVIMRARPTVLPVWIQGLSNDFFRQATATLRKDAPPITILVGEPVEFGPLLDATPRPAQYKRVADHVRSAILRLGERGRSLRAAAKSSERGRG